VNEMAKHKIKVKSSHLSSSINNSYNMTSSVAQSNTTSSLGSSTRVSQTRQPLNVGSYAINASTTSNAKSYI
jgi:hypothetical protein